ncbi:hypothetical protein F4781DRAFT_437225 [Annulohypoxylon bovei var. microspora]|nr:hypothetical protein F4781DRAFT_437225 [Annulohypoxylon bovei var. microspora]
MSSDTPLLGQDASNSRYEDEQQAFVESWKSGYHRAQTAISRFTNSRTRHWILLVLIILDVAGILSDIFIALITCEIGIENDEWVAPTRSALAIFSLVMSFVFLAELALSLFANGWGYFRSWFHRFDAFVVVAGLAVDLIENNTAEEIASLIVILRLWRFVKIVDEFSVEASEEMEDLRKRVEELESRNAALEAQVARR